MKSIKTKIVVSLIGIIVLYQGGKWGYGEAAEAYFNHKCETEAGEFIYRTVDNVEGVFQMRPRDPRDYFTRIREGDIPEDPYGHTNMEGQNPHSMFLEVPMFRIPSKTPYKFFETTKAPNAGEYYDRRFPKTKLVDEPVITGDKYWRYTFSHNDKEKGSFHEAVQIEEPISNFAFTWKEIRDKWDELFGVWGGELIVKELKSDEIIGIKKGFFFRNELVKRGGLCPKGKGYYPTYDFISKVLIPSESE